MALDQGHPVYVILFSTRPVAGQTLDHVQLAMARFVEMVLDRHPQAGNLAIIGNCQAGWAAALLGAVRPDITGPIVMNDHRVDLKALKGPIVVFASHGDNITPPQQALNWIPAQWGSVDEIRRRQQTIVYMVHGTIGHLGIFVSAGVSRKEHREIIASIDLMDYLSPGLYEMVIYDDDDGVRQVRFEAREMADILALDDGDGDQAAFGPAEMLSRYNDLAYRRMVRPWIKAAVNEATAEVLRQLHPLRTSCYGFSDLNPWMAPVEHLAGAAKQQRRPVLPDNPFSAMEKIYSEAVSKSLNLYRDYRDRAIESWFYAMFDNPWMRAISTDVSTDDDRSTSGCRAGRLEEVNTGGFAEAVVRIMVALAHAGTDTRRRSLAAYDGLAGRDVRLADLHGVRLGEMIKKQSRIMKSAPEASLSALSRLLPSQADRKKALAIASSLMLNASDADAQVVRMGDAIAAVLAM